MPVEHLQCPSCGAPVRGEGGPKPAVCPYCGSSLRIGAAVLPVPAPFADEMRQDTELLSRRAALEHLQRQLEALESQRDTGQRVLQEQITAMHAGHQLGCWSVALLAMGGLSVLGGMGNGDAGPIIIGVALVVAVLVWSAHRRSALAKREATVRKACEPAIADLTRRAEETRARIGRVQAAIDQLVNRY